MFEPKIRIQKALFEKLKSAAEIRGASSLEEFVERILEGEADRILRTAGKAPVTEKEVEDIANKMKGLGYLE